MIDDRSYAHVEDAACSHRNRRNRREIHRRQRRARRSAHDAGICQRAHHAKRRQLSRRIRRHGIGVEHEVVRRAVDRQRAASERRSGDREASATTPSSRTAPARPTRPPTLAVAVAGASRSVAAYAESAVMRSGSVVGRRPAASALLRDQCAHGAVDLLGRRVPLEQELQHLRLRVDQRPQPRPRRGEIRGRVAPRDDRACCVSWSAIAVPCACRPGARSR